MTDFRAYIKLIEKINTYKYNKAKNYIDFLAKPIGSLG